MDVCIQTLIQGVIVDGIDVMCCWLGVIANLGLRVIESNFNSLELWPSFWFEKKSEL